MKKRKLKKSWSALLIVIICIVLAVFGLSYYNRLKFSPQKDANQYSSEDLYAGVSSRSYIASNADTGECYYDNELIVMTTKNAMSKVLDKVQDLYNCKFAGKNGYDHSFLVRFPDGQNYAQLTKRLNRIKNIDGVKEVSLNYAVTIDSEDEPYVKGKASHSWGYKAIKASEGYTYRSLMNAVPVGIMDTGFDTSAEDLNGKLTTLGNHTESDHGTAMAGIIGADPTNKEGIAGVMSEVKMYGVSVEKYTSIYAIMTNLHILNQKGCKVIDLSIACDELNFAACQDNTNAKNAIRRMSKLLAYSINDFEKPSLLIASSGNTDGYKYCRVDDAFYGYKKLIKKNGKTGFYDDKGIFRTYNANVYGEKLTATSDAYWNLFGYIDDSQMSSKIIVVGSAKKSGKKYKISTYSVSGTRVDVLAPGEGIYSLKPSTSSGYGLYSGTSCSAAYVSGLAGALLSIDQKLTVTDLQSYLINTATISTDDLPMVNMENAIDTLLKEHPIKTTITGRVLDENKKPLANASVTTTANGEKIASVKTKSDGTFTVNAYAGKTKLQVKSTLYASYNKTYTISKKTMKTGDIVLDKEKWKELYVDFIKKHKGDSYALWKVDDNNTPELMIFSDTHNYFVTYKNKVLYYLDMGPALTSRDYSEKENLVYVSYSQNNAIYECYYKVGDSRIRTVHIGQQSTGADGKTSYIWDSASVNAKTYQKNSQNMQAKLHHSAQDKTYDNKSVEKAVYNY